MYKSIKEFYDIDTGINFPKGSLLEIDTTNSDEMIELLEKLGYIEKED